MNTPVHRSQYIQKPVNNIYAVCKSRLHEMFSYVLSREYHALHGLGGASNYIIFEHHTCATFSAHTRVLIATLDRRRWLTSHHHKTSANTASPWYGHLQLNELVKWWFSDGQNTTRRRSRTAWKDEDSTGSLKFLASYLRLVHLLSSVILLFLCQFTQYASMQVCFDKISNMGLVGQRTM